MNRLLVVVLVVVVCVVGLGFYLEWFNVGSESADGKGHITLSVDQNKIKADEKKALEKLRGTGAAEKSKDPASPPVQAPQN